MAARKRKTYLPFAILLLITLLTYLWLPTNYFKSKPDCVGMDIAAGKDIQTAAVEYIESKKPSEFRYFFETFEENGARTFMVVSMRDGNVCFDAKILVEKWDKLEGMKKANGKSYPKELYDLKWHLEPRHDGLHILYDDMRSIID